jgi:ankyrin repeat protein
VKDLKASNVKKVWITSRPVMGEILENQFSSLSYVLKPFSEEDKSTFVYKFWGIEHDEKLEKFVRKLLKLTGTSVKGSLGKFTDIPLHTMMLAEVFKPQVLRYSKTCEDKLPNKLNLLELYEGFRDRKLEIYQKDKMGMDTSKPAASEGHETLKNVFVQNHMECALITLLGHEKVRKLSNEGRNLSDKVKKFLDKFKRGEDYRGFIVDVMNERAIFIHGTFVEFFVAEWLSHNYKQNTKFAQDIIVAPQFELLRHFFNRIMVKGSNFHNAILNQEEETVESLLSQQTFVLHEPDRGGRTALHLAVMSYSEGTSEAGDNIVQILLKHKADHRVKDKVFHLSPLSLAERMGVWSAVNLLLQNHADKEDLVLTKNNLDNDEYVQILLKEATSRGLLEILKFVFEDCRIDINYRLNAVSSWGKEITWTPLMWAVNHCNVESVNFLLAKDVDIDAKDESGCTALYLACKINPALC